MIMNYADTITLSSTITPAYHQFRLNSLFDPDYTAVGHQPLYYDQLALLYKNYRVHAAKIDVSFVNATDATAALVGYSVKPNTSASATFDDMKEQPLCAARHIASDAAGPASTVFRRYFKLSKIFGEALTDNNYQADTTNNPSSVAYFTIYSQCADESTSQTVIAYVHLSFYCEWFGLLSVTGS